MSARVSAARRVRQSENDVQVDRDWHRLCSLMAIEQREEKPRVQPDTSILARKERG
jgi:hypothetical protein